MDLPTASDGGVGRAQPVQQTPAAAMKKSQRIPLLVFNMLLMAVGIGGSILNRVYFLHGGKRLWLSSLVQLAGWPLALITLFLLYFLRRRSKSGHARTTKLVYTTPRLALAAVGLGVIFGLDAYLYAYGSSYLPVSTSAILISTQLAFTALFAFLLVGQRLTAFSLNAVVLLVLGAVMLGLAASGDRPEGESRAKYSLGFAMTLAAAALYGLMLPLVEMAYRRLVGRMTYTVVLEFQTLIGIVGSVFCLVGMVVNNDFQAMAREAREYGLGEAKYWTVVISSAVLWEFFTLGAVGVIFCSSSLLSGVVFAVLIPVSDVLAVILLQEKFMSSKGISLALALWGFASYLYGEREQSRKEEEEEERVKVTPEVQLLAVP